MKEGISAISKERFIVEPAAIHRHYRINEERREIRR